MKRLLRQARADPSNFAALERLHGAINTAADALPAGEARTAIKRRLSTSAGELGPLEECARRLMKATESSK